VAKQPNHVEVNAPGEQPVAHGRRRLVLPRGENKVAGKRSIGFADFGPRGISGGEVSGNWLEPAERNSRIPRQPLIDPRAEQADLFRCEAGSFFGHDAVRIKT